MSNSREDLEEPAAIKFNKRINRSREKPVGPAFARSRAHSRPGYSERSSRLGYAKMNRSTFLSQVQHLITVVVSGRLGLVTLLVSGTHSRTIASRQCRETFPAGRGSSNATISLIQAKCQVSGFQWCTDGKIVPSTGPLLGWPNETPSGE